MSKEYSFDEIYNKTYQDVLKFVICNCSNIEDVKDIMQNIYTCLYKKIRNTNIDDIDKYVIGIARHKIKDYYRFKYKTKIVSLFSKEKEILSNIPSLENIEKEMIKSEDIDLIWDYLNTKKVIIPKIFYLYYYLGFTLKDISKELDISESNVKHYLYRTLKELNMYLESGDKNE